MAHIKKVGEKWRAEVCIDRKRRAKTFPTKREAKAWADDQEADGLLAHHTLREAIEKYRPIAESHKGSQSELSRLRAIETHADCIDTALDRLTPTMLTAYRDKRLQMVKPVSVRREMIILGALFRVAVREWGWLRASPLEGVKKPPTTKGRQRGVTQKELSDTLAELAKMRVGPQVALMFELSIETGMRLSEIAGIRWEHVAEKTVRLPQTKNGDARTVPLSARAREIIKARENLDPETVFTLSSSVASKTFQRARSAAGHPTLHFHDARSEAITRLSRKVDVLQLARIVGQRDLRSLMIYYAESADAIADRL